MKKLLLATAALSLLSSTASAAAPSGSTRTEALREAALKDDIAWNIVEGLTTEIGPRLAGTESEARARQWAVTKLKALGFKNVRIEPYEMAVWTRGDESAEILAPFPQPLKVTALGRSGATPAGGVTGEIVAFASLDALRAADAATVKGKIVYITHEMRATQDGSGYGYFGPARFAGPGIAAGKGAAAVVIKSVGTDHHRHPHTGMTSWPEGVQAIPAGALSVNDGEQLERVLKRGKPVTMKLVLTPRWIGNRQSGNVVAEVPGSDPAAGVIVIGGHLDSWDLGTGAIDNAAGVAITAAAAKRIMEAGQPRRTIRVIWTGAEEVGVFGGTAYFDAHKDENIVLVSESDFGADRIWRMQSNVAPANAALVDRVAAALAPLGIARGTGKASGGADVSKFAAAGTAVIDLNQDGTRYFDYHHTPDDTLDKVDPEQLRQNVAAWTAMLSVVANAPEEIGKAPVAAQ
jgi:hypothetical protein